MANPPCMSDDGRQAVFVGTFLEGGDTVALCGECLPDFTASVTASMLGIPADVFQAEMARLSAEHADVEPGDPAEVAAPPAMPDEQAIAPDQVADLGELHLVPTTAEGAPTDEPPADQPADTDPDAAGTANPEAEAPPPQAVEAQAGDE